LMDSGICSPFVIAQNWNAADAKAVPKAALCFVRVIAK
jgi:hypothetical protein